MYDPRTRITAWTNNVALCVRDDLTSDYGFDCGSEVVDTYFGAANLNAESVTLADWEGSVVEFIRNHFALQLCAFDVVNVTNAQLGWNAKSCRVLKWGTADVGRSASFCGRS